LNKTCADILQQENNNLRSTNNRQQAEINELMLDNITEHSQFASGNLTSI